MLESEVEGAFDKWNIWICSGWAEKGRVMGCLRRKAQWSVQTLVRLLRLVVSTSYDSAVHTQSKPLTH